jgi:hypothetical protein
MRVVLDTNILISALLIQVGHFLKRTWTDSTAAGQQANHVDSRWSSPICCLGESPLKFGSPHWQRMKPLMRPATEYP